VAGAVAPITTFHSFDDIRETKARWQDITNVAGIASLFPEPRNTS
jgi:hypothetical protein